ncbi:hypothetical protein IFM46972_00938 [Aspergillus udagawae]|uniref:Uncharacterized protein n=1 Tax=Aspergillus udagawae TaxID=91492 RepID=A0A8H3N5Q9_9EURO|nr:hypothetical protein IFM46972_00938 [Aspergillus udagawae]
MSDLGFIVDDHRGKVDSGHGSHAEQLRLWLNGRVDFRWAYTLSRSDIIALLADIISRPGTYGVPAENVANLVLIHQDITHLRRIDTPTPDDNNKVEEVPPDEVDEEVEEVTSYEDKVNESPRSVTPQNTMALITASQSFLNVDKNTKLAVTGYDSFSPPYTISFKEPEFYIESHGCTLPTIVFEVGYSEPYPRLIRDRDLWLWYQWYLREVESGKLELPDYEKLHYLVDRRGLHRKLPVQPPLEGLMVGILTLIDQPKRRIHEANTIAMFAAFGLPHNANMTHLAALDLISLEAFHDGPVPIKGTGAVAIDAGLRAGGKASDEDLSKESEDGDEAAENGDASGSITGGGIP